ncbi:hypothetical protein [uncultured Methylobacterium sp.]|uniref:hypothetical protein n=1 Tax=uncultured Methylobacterium sp. TaxID=157278 RepID=UPI0035C9A3FF
MKKLILVAAAIGGASIMATSASAEAQCGDVSNAATKYKLNVKNESQDPIWYTIYKTKERDYKSNWGCVMPGQIAQHHPYDCGGSGYWVLGEQKRGSNCNGSNVSEPMYNLKLPPNDRGMIIFKNNSRGERIWADTSKYR